MDDAALTGGAHAKNNCWASSGSFHVLHCQIRENARIPQAPVPESDGFSGAGVSNPTADRFRRLCSFKACRVSDTWESESQNAVIAFCCDSKGLFTRFQGGCGDDVTVVAGSSSTTLLPRFSGTSAQFKGIEPLKRDGQT